MGCTTSNPASPQNSPTPSPDTSVDLNKTVAELRRDAALLNELRGITRDLDEFERKYRETGAGTLEELVQLKNRKLELERKMDL